MLLRTCVLKDMMLCHWPSSSDILNNCSAFQTAGTACTTTHQPEALNLLTYIIHGKGCLVSNCLLPLFPKNCTHFSILLFTNINQYKNKTVVQYQTRSMHTQLSNLGNVMLLQTAATLINMSVAHKFKCFISCYI